MKKIEKIIMYSICCFAFLYAVEPIHDSIYNVPYSTAIYDNGLVSATPFALELNGKDHDLDVSDDFFISTSGRQENLLERAVLLNNIEQVQQLLKKQPMLINYQNKDGRTALHYATAHNNSSMVHILLDHGANSNLQDLQGWTPLHIAVQDNLYAIAQMLLDRGADASIKNFENYSPKDYVTNDRMRAIITLTIV